MESSNQCTPFIQHQVQSDEQRVPPQPQFRSDGPRYGTPSSSRMSDSFKTCRVSSQPGGQTAFLCRSRGGPSSGTKYSLPFLVAVNLRSTSPLLTLHGSTIDGDKMSIIGIILCTAAGTQCQNVAGIYVGGILNRLETRVYQPILNRHNTNETQSHSTIAIYIATVYGNKASTPTYPREGDVASESMWEMAFSGVRDDL